MMSYFNDKNGQSEDPWQSTPDTNHDQHNEKMVNEEEAYDRNLKIPDDFIMESREMARKFKEQFDNLKDAFQSFEPSEEPTEFYLLSLKWLGKWKKYVSYDEMLEGKPPAISMYQVRPGKINSDLLLSDVSERNKYMLYSAEKLQYCNTILRDGLNEGQDYIIVNEKIWSLLCDEYNGYAIKRYQHDLDKGVKRVEVHLKKINVLIITNATLRIAESEKINEFEQKKIQTSSFRKITDFKEDLMDFSKMFLGSDYIYYTIKSDSVRLWKLAWDQTPAKFFQMCKETCKKTPNYDYKISFPGEYLEKNPENPLGDAQIADNDFVVIEVRVNMQNPWIFFGDSIESEGRCDSCYSFKALKYQCKCQKVSYCSPECQNKDRSYHMSRCTFLEEDNDDEKVVLTEDSRRGVCGLQNLGNTCFMNSALQCLSNTWELTQYFLEHKYKAEINKENALGTQGVLATKFAVFLRNLWAETASVFSPWSLKQAIGKFQPNFQGYAQHDSQELLSYVLDGLHEDLNRVKKKPYVESIENENKPDEEIARLCWKNHCLRNSSEIVDLMHGQFKSLITCPQCQRISITYDPFMMCSLPIPMTNSKSVNLWFIWADPRKKSVQLTCEYQKETHKISDLRQFIAKKLEIPENSFVFTLASNYSKEIVNESDLTHRVRKSGKLKNFLAIELTKEELEFSPDEKTTVDAEIERAETTYFNRTIRRNCSHVRSFQVKKSMTMAELHLMIFRKIRYFLECHMSEEGKAIFEKLSDEDAYAKLLTPKTAIEDGDKEKEDGADAKNENLPPYEVIITTRPRSWNASCYFCGKDCENCPLPFSSELTVADLQERAAKAGKAFALEICFAAYCEKYDYSILSGYEEEKMGGSGHAAKGGKVVSLQECLKFFEEPEKLEEDNTWYCNKCKEHVQATKKMVIYKAPPVLILHLKRFKNSASISYYSSRKKNSDFIDFPVDLDLSEFVMHPEIPNAFLAQENPAMEVEKDGNPAGGEMKEESNGKISSPLKANGMEVEPNKNLNYELYAVINHYGDLGGGHYTAYGKNPMTNKWYNYDDSHVEEMKMDGLQTTAAYVLFYRKKK